jgi:hypothetical protein
LIIRQKHFKAIDYWIATDFLVVAGLLLIMLRGHIPNFFSITLAMALFIFR